jgi:hypothetical protein
MNARRKLKPWWMALAISLVAAGQASLLAATSVRTADGALLSVHEVRPGNNGDAARALAFTLENGSRTRSGYIGRTMDRAIDQSPSLSLDPRSGNPVLVWSRSDGISLKVAYARFERGSWRDIRILTFGPSDDLLPRIESSRDGSFLYWSDAIGNAFYAPVDTATGRFFAAPRELPAPTVPSPSDNALAGGAGGGFVADGGHDVPVIIGRCDGTKTDPCVDGQGSLGSGNPPPSPPSTDASDIPIIWGMVTPPATPGTATASNPECDTQVVAVASSTSSTIVVLRIQPSGEAIRVATLKVAPGVLTSDAAAAAAAFYLHAACDE